MADLYLKALTSERRALWAECRLKGLAKDTPQRQRIVEIDALHSGERKHQRREMAAQLFSWEPSFLEQHLRRMMVPCFLEGGF